ncbi:unnamed protein product, partial [Ixodes pacificus]
MRVGRLMLRNSAWWQPSTCSFFDFRITGTRTMASRYKDCSAFTALGQTLVTTGIPIEELHRWMLVRAVAEEAVERTRETEELEDEYSYSAYLSDLKLVTKSPYSAVSNTLLHLWLHSLGSLLLSERSLNARRLNDNTFNPILANTALLAFVQCRSTGFVISFVDTQEQATREGKLLGKPDLSVTVAGMPTSMVAADWFAWIAEQGFVLPHSIYHFFHKAMSGVVGLRDGSVGKKV